MPEKLTIEHIKEVCKIGQGTDCCRYLTMGAKGWNCEKFSSLRSVLDARGWAGLMAAQGDNCEGIKEVNHA